MKVRLLSNPSFEDWMLVKKAAFRTIGKDAKIEPKMEWRRKMLKAVHSPIRLLNYTVLLEGVPSWVSVHLVRHVHAIPFVTTQRNDRMDRDETYDRRKAPQDTPIDMIWSFNAEELMTICHKRLCMLASKETRECVQEVVRVITKECPEWEGTDLLVPLCTYRGGLCSEFMPCQYYLEHGHGFISPRLSVKGTEPSYDEVMAWVRKRLKSISHEEFMALSSEMRKARGLEDAVDPRVISTWQTTGSHYTVNPDGSKAAIELYDKLHDPRKLYLCERCHCTWKCEYRENKFGNSPGPNEDPDVLCPECGSNKIETNEAVIYATLSDRGGLKK